MAIKILMPALSPTMEEGNLAKWLVKEGDNVSAGDVIAEIETDKATMEVESIDDGVVGKILVAEGTEAVKVNELIAVLLEDGEDASAVDAMMSSDAQPAQPQIEAKGEDTPASVQVSSNTQEPQQKDRIFSSPLARRIAKQNELDIAQVSGSGPRGRVVKRDVEAVLAAGATKLATAPAPTPVVAVAPAAPQGQSDEQIFKLFDEGSYELIPHDGMRKTIAKRLTESKQTVPHFYLTVECQLDELLALRSQLNKSAPVDKEGNAKYKLSVNDMIIKAHALALKAVPAANASWSDNGMLMHKHSDVGVAVSVDGGLITPIIRRAEEKTLSTISLEMKDLAKRARERKLKPLEYQGGTSAVSNLGMFGIKEFSAVINPPHATILAVGAGIKQPIVKKDEISVGTVMSVTLSTDHRAVDGVLGAQLLQAFKRFIEHPMSMLV
ncbi:pyruvate dehydrogenase complex dihydrolipoamide acetyltransferase [Flexibacterium corallicola]|uniref:pyruvate dehydrogenase complex dihydrolipoamide acetyltransferase n=1 Tax=Flexibacterium corallicola TaxID=3037259 RepID=UPI00286EE7DB|nr:pyruvate dehydrogenase complex dihydrolipoamide acetyltransferase [Pseudovibrio sp. M1P-2-3]